MKAPAFAAVDWGTTRLRASLIAADGAVLARRASDAGVQSVKAGGFPGALEDACRPWFEVHPGLRVLMSGMVGSRNGWVETPYLPCPAGAAEIARHLTPLPGLGREVEIVPGVDCRWPDGAYDVMRGEEVQALGTGVGDGLVALPGTHSKWIEMRDGRIVRFATFVTGELFAAVSASFVGRLAQSPEDPAGGEIAAETARSPGGLTRALFQARARVLGATLPPRGVKPFLSRLLIEAEIAGAIDLFGRPSLVHLVAGEPQLSLYRSALDAHGVGLALHDTENVTLRGLKTLMAARG